MLQHPMHSLVLNTANSRHTIRQILTILVKNLFIVLFNNNLIKLTRDVAIAVIYENIYKLVLDLLLAS